MVARIVFSSEVYIKGDNIEDIKKSFLQLPLFPMIRDNNVVEGVDFYELRFAEDADTYQEIPFDL